MLTEETKIALIGKDIANIQKDMAEMKISLKELTTVYVSREMLAETAHTVESRLEVLERSSKFWKFATPTLSMITGFVIEYLFLFYLQHK